MIVFLIAVMTFIAAVLIRLVDYYTNTVLTEVLDVLRFSALLLSLGGLTGSVYLVVKAFI